jgi:hypothetical protein
MTAYFDDLRREVHELSRVHPGADDFLEAVAVIEARVLATVRLVTGDREFPDDLRERILGHAAVLAVDFVPGLPPTRGRDVARACRFSPLLEELHDDFHAVARRRVMTRFGVLSDDPSGILRRRAAVDEE